MSEGDREGGAAPPEAPQAAPAAERRVRRTALLAGALCLGMFGFGYALVPLYDLFCEVTGFGGRVVGAAEESAIADAQELPSRQVSLRLTATVGSTGMFDFSAPASQITIDTGEFSEFSYSVLNKSAGRVVGQAIPSIVPAEASSYVKKLECFCFDQQVLDPNVATELPVRLYVDRRLPETIDEITLSYVYYDSSEQNAELLNIDHSMH